LKEFEKIDLEKDILEQLDPPAFKRALKAKEEVPALTDFDEELLKTKARKIESKLCSVFKYILV